MSTILDALKKVERQRESPREQVLHAPAGAPERRRSSMPLIAACAVVGLTSGIGLALWRNDRAAEVDAPPESAPPAAIDVPAAPAAPEQVAIAKPEAARGETSERPDAIVPPQEGQAESPPVAAPPPMAAVPPLDSAPVAPPLPAAPPASDSALEPSPFTPPRAEEDTRVASVPPAASRPEAAAVPAAPAAPVPPPVQPQPPAQAAPPETVAAVPPPEPEAAIPPVEAEPPPPPPALLDTGRSPPGLPKFALSFLQWSEDPARRFAFVSIDGGPSQRVREGDMAGGCLVAEITPGGVQFKRDDKIFTIRPRH